MAEIRQIEVINPCTVIGHAFYRVARANLMQCRRCQKVVFKDFGTPKSIEKK